LSFLEQSKRVVIKLGTGVLTSGIGQLNTDRIATLCKQVAQLRANNQEVVIVSSGSIGLGMGKLKLDTRPKDLATLQACASIGQSILINTWQQGFDPADLTVAQILLTREDLRHRHRHNAIFNTIEQLLARGIVPIVNENDTVSASEIKFGDNDTLSALVASVINADLLCILSNIPGLMDLDNGEVVIPRVESITPEIEALAQGTKHTTSVGGMISKLSAAKIAQRAGCGVLIASGEDDGLFDALRAGASVGTFFVPSKTPVQSHKRWIAIQDQAKGTLKIDSGAAVALVESGKSLLAVGIKTSEGNFEAGDLVRIQTEDGVCIAKGVVRVESHALIATLESDDKTAELVVHRDELVLL
jgi:glutamate 5-kinase